MRRALALVAGVLVALSLTGCTSDSIAGITIKHVRTSRGTVECAIAGSTSGGPSVDCDWDHLVER